MKITHIAAKNFKGLSFIEALSPLTMFVGSNFRGKSARTDAIRLALLGYLPELGATNKATFSLASGAVMSVEATFDNGLSLFRKWSLKGNSVTCEESIPEEIKNAGQLAVMLNSDVYFSLSDQKRVEYVFGLVDIAGVWTAKGIASRISEKVPASVTPPAEGKKSIIAEILGHSVVPVPVQQFVGDALATVAELWKLANADVKRKESTIVTLTQARAADTFSGPSMSTLDATRKMLAAEIALMNEDKGTKLAAFTAMVSARQRREAIDRELRFGDKNRAALATLKDNQALAKKTLDDYPVFSRVDLKVINNEVNGLKIDAQGYMSAAADHRRKEGAAKQALLGLAAQTACPCCGASGENWKGLKTKEYALEIDFEQKAAKEEQAKADAIQPEIERLNKQYAEIEQHIGQRENLVAKLQEITAQISTLEPQLARLTAMSEERALLAPEDAQLDASVQAIQTNLNVKNEELRGVEASIKALQGREHEKKRMADAEAERDAAKKEAETAKAVGVELKVIQGEMVASVFAPLLEYANSFFSDIMLSPLAYHDGEIGTWRGGNWVGHHTMSGTERALVYAAIQAALASKSPVKLMIIDELGRLTDENIERVLDAVSNAIERGRLEQFCGIEAGDKLEGSYANSDCKVISVS